jgi:hypothetical protein
MLVSPILAIREPGLAAQSTVSGQNTATPDRGQAIERYRKSNPTVPDFRREDRSVPESGRLPTEFEAPTARAEAGNSATDRHTK